MLHNAFKPSYVIWQGPYEDLDRVAWFLMRYETRGTYGFWGREDIKLGALVERRLVLDTEDVYEGKIARSFLLCVTFTILAFDTDSRYATRMGGPWTQPMPEGYDWDARGFGHLFYHWWTKRFRSDALSYPCLTPTLDFMPAPGAGLLSYGGWQGRKPVTDEWNYAKEVADALQHV